MHKSAEFSETVASITSANHLPGRNIQRRKQTRRSVAEVIVSVAFRTATGHQQWWLGTIQSLHLTFFVDTTNNRTIRRMQVQPDDMTHLVDELRSFRLFERFSSVWLKARCDESRSESCRLPPPHCGCSSAFVLWFCLQSSDENVLNLLVRDLAWSARSWFIHQTFQTCLDKASTSLSDGQISRLLLLRHRTIRHAIHTR